MCQTASNNTAKNKENVTNNEERKAEKVGNLYTALT